MTEVKYSPKHEEYLELVRKEFDYFCLAAEKQRNTDPELQYMFLFHRGINFKNIEDDNDLKHFIESVTPQKSKAILLGHGYGNVIASWDYTELYPLIMKYEKVWITSCMQDKFAIGRDLFCFFFEQTFPDVKISKKLWKLILQVVDINFILEHKKAFSQESLLVLDEIQKVSGQKEVISLVKTFDPVSICQIFERIVFISQTMLNEMYIDDQLVCYGFPARSQFQQQRQVIPTLPHQLDLTMQQFETCKNNPALAKQIIDHLCLEYSHLFSSATMMDILCEKVNELPNMLLLNVPSGL